MSISRDVAGADSTFHGFNSGDTVASEGKALTVGTHLHVMSIEVVSW